MRVLITGGNGQLGRELQFSSPENIEIVAFDKKGLDISDESAVTRIVRETGPTVIINAAAYTAVDEAEQERDLAYRINSQGPAQLAQAARENGARLIHISTDFVFEGTKSQPYQPEDQTSPVGVYGASKLEGEKKVMDIMPDRTMIMRTAWVYASDGNNFVNTMLRLMGERDELNVVADQIGSPTWARGLAQAIWKATALPALAGIYHWTDAGVASWFDFAMAIQEEALTLGLLEKKIPIHPIRTQDYPTPAVRPAYSVLDKTSTWKALGLEASHWRISLREMLSEKNKIAESIFVK